MLDSYEDEYRAHASDATAKLEAAETATRFGDDRRAHTVAAERAIEAAKDVVQLLDMELGALPKAQRGALSTRLRCYRSELSELARRIKECQRSESRAASAAASDCIREELFSASSGAGARGDADESLRMLASTHDRLTSARDHCALLPSHGP